MAEAYFSCALSVVERVVEDVLLAWLGNGHRKKKL